MQDQAREDARCIEITQYYPKRKRRWVNPPLKRSDESFVITDQFGDPSLVLSRSFFFEDPEERRLRENRNYGGK